jgi:hypothetical protein
MVTDGLGIIDPYFNQKEYVVNCILSSSQENNESMRKRKRERQRYKSSSRNTRLQRWPQKD